MSKGPNTSSEPDERGRQSISEKLVREIVRRIVSVSKPERIIIFGSASTGQMTKDSDIDLLVLERETQDSHGERIRIRRALNGLDYPFDIIVMPTERFEESKTVIGGIAYPANKYGRVVYEVA
jgi:predicted nucleotidyltransferase